MGISIEQILGGSLGQAVKDIVGAFKLDPTVKAQLEAQIEQNQDLLIQKQMEFDAKLNDVAGANIRAEEQSGDKYTMRARPSVIWVGLGVIVFNFCLMNFLKRWGFAPMDLPDAFWWTWGTVVTGYVFNRSAQEIMKMPGDSKVKLGPIELSQKTSQ